MSKANPKLIQQKILGLINRHIDQISKCTWFDENTSSDLSRYLKIVNEFVEHDQNMLQSGIKDVEQLSEHEVDQLILEHSSQVKNK